MTTKCDTCGFQTAEPLKITYHDKLANYCCFECAITALAPQCPRCNCKVVGHGTYGVHGETFCSSHCAQLVPIANG